MSTQQHLTRAPIVEAVIDLRAKTPVGIDIEVFKVIGGDFSGAYPKTEGITMFEATASIDQTGKAPPPQQIIQQQIGYRHISADGKFIVQFRKDGFTFSRLAPYTEWSEVFSEAKKLFLLYLEIGKVEEINRIAVRYINVMQLPSDNIGNFARYLTAPPRFPAAQPSFLNSFLTQVQIVERDTGIFANVIQAVQPTVSVPVTIPVILDIDVFQAANFSINPELIFAKIEVLREKKNQIFFDSITEEAKTLFK